MRVSEIRVKRIRVNQGLGVLCIRQQVLEFPNLTTLTPWLMRTFFYANFTCTTFLKVFIPHLTRMYYEIWC